MPTEPKDLYEYKTDHDLIIEIRSEMGAMRREIEKLNDGISKRLDKAETRTENLEKAVSSLQTTRAVAYAYAGLITLVLIPIAAAYIQTGRL